MENLFRYFNENVQKRPESIVFFPSRKTFAKVQTEIDKTKNEFHRQGLRTGDRCLIVTPLGEQFHINLIALLQMGAVPVLIDLALGWRMVSKALKIIDIRFFVFRKRLIAFPLFRQKVNTVDPADIIYFTSGSTGVPKPIYYKTSDLITQIEILRRSRFTVNESEVISLKKVRDHTDRILYGYSSLPVFGLYQLLMGMGIWSSPLRTAKELQCALEGRDRGVLTDLCLNPKIISEWVDILNSRYIGISDYIERVVVVSNSLSKPLLEQVRLKMPLHCLLEQTYGSTEAFPLCVVVRSKPGWNPTNLLDMVNVGKSFSEFQIHLRQSDKKHVLSQDRSREVGQVWLQNSSGKVLNTGDLGFQDEQGRLTVLGREKYTYVYAGKTYFSLLWELKAREVCEVKDVVMMQESPTARPVLIVCWSASEWTNSVKLDDPYYRLGQKRIVKKTDLAVCLELRELLTKEFNCEVELLFTHELPLDPRHKSKVLRDRINVRTLRWSLRNVRLRYGLKRLNTKKSNLALKEGQDLCES